MYTDNRDTKNPSEFHSDEETTTRNGRLVAFMRDRETFHSFPSFPSSRQAEKELRRETYSTLHSIHHDSNFVGKVATHFPAYPVIANERCGRWYIPHDLYHSSAYFKSTDGHYSHWSFNTRRLNLDFLHAVLSHAGAILVDSTRRGKRMPDALSKTVPIWCAVLNRYFLRWNQSSFPDECVSAQEKSYIETLIPSFVTAFKNCGIDLEAVALKKFTKPLRPVFITPESDLDVVLSSNEYYPVILLTASTLVSSGHQRVGGFVYVQGAADDEESWSHGLTSAQFWQSQNELLACTTEDELISLIKEIMGRPEPRELTEESKVIEPSRISLGIGSTVESCPTIICGSDSIVSREENGILYVNIPAKAKVVHVMVHDILPTIVSFALKHDILNNTPIAIKAANSSRETLDLSIAVTLVLLSLFIDDNGLHSHFLPGG